MTIPKLSILVSVILLATSLPVTVFSQPELDVEATGAVLKSDVPTLATWFANGGDINSMTKTGNTLLMMAAKIGDKQTLDFLFSQLPDVNIQNKVGATALMIAAKYGHAHAVELLLDHGANPLIRNNNGITAARFAQAYKHDDVFYLLQKAEMRAQIKL